MHHGLFDHLDGIVNLYNAGGARPQPREDFKDDPLFPETTPLLQPLGLTQQDTMDLVAFLKVLWIQP